MNANKRFRQKGYALRHNHHSISMLTCHMVFCPKYRRAVLSAPMQARCREVFLRQARKLGVVIKQMAVNPDHVHLFLIHPPKVSTSVIAQRFKCESSRVLRLEFPELRDLNETSLWAPSCYYGSVGQGFDVVEAYVRNQKSHHGH